MPGTSSSFDLAVVGSGFGGSLLAMIGRRLGWSVVLLEKDRHPRFAIGESSTPLANLLLEEIARAWDLPRLLPLSKWGTWQEAHPEVGCGLKRGFTFYHHQLDAGWRGAPDHADQLLVAASPRDRIADTHWYRQDFDRLLVEEAQRLGAELVDNLHLRSIRCTGSAHELEATRDGRDLSFRARWVIDASGPRGFLHRALALPEASFRAMPRTETLYTHFRDVRRWDALHPEPEKPPYPVDDAAMHHVFEGGWIWVLRFNNGLISAGVAAEPALAKELRLAEGAPAWTRLLARLPSVRDQFRDASPSRPFRHASPLPFRSGRVTGPGWALLPSAAGFVDPLLSTGFPLTLLGVQRLARVLELARGGAHDATLETSLSAYAAQTLAELDITAELVAGLYACFDDFELFADLALLYFAAAMYAETVRRLGRPEKAPAFLLHTHASFGPALRACLDTAHRKPSGQARTELRATLQAAIEPFNVAALGDPRRRHWYPALAADLLAAAPKLEASSAEIQSLLARCGF